MAPTPKPYFILSEVATQDKINKLLGRAIPFTSAKAGEEDNPLKRPAEGHIYPILPPDGPDLRKLDEQLYPQGVKAKEARALLENAQGQEAKIAINKALALFHHSEKSNRRAASIPGFRRLTIDQAHHRITQLLKHPEYSEPILDYFTKFPNGKLAIIVSIICAMDMSLNVQHTQSSETSAEVEIPSEAMGAPPRTADTSARLSITSTKVSEAEGTYDGEVVVACGYVQMTRKPQSLLKSFLQYGPKVFFRPKGSTLDDITITNEFVQPSTMTVSFPPTRIPGDQEAILGGTVDTNEHRFEASVNATHDDDDSDDDMVLYA
ncbi:hypothetical protein F4804DRAFT_304320 [Jackrogersella minutella]|nr:hypothetical protein F4804DRAFT_304320 [Jackrogersella minutella]